MTETPQSPDERASQVPLTEMLAGVPATARVMVPHSPFYSQSIPVGRYCAEALAEINRLRAALAATPLPVPEVPQGIYRDRQDSPSKEYAGVRCMCVVTNCRAPLRGPGCPSYTEHCRKHIEHARPLPTLESIYRGKCPNGDRCIHGCHRSDASCYAEVMDKRGADNAASRPLEATQPLVDRGEQGCNCRWIGEETVQRCEVHEAWFVALHEWAERAKKAEASLALVHQAASDAEPRTPAPQLPVVGSEGDAA